MRKSILIFPSLLFLCLIVSSQSWASSIVVINSDDAGAGSLRDAVATATSGDTILFDAGTNGNPIQLDSQIVLGKNLVIIGNNTSNTIIDCQQKDRAFFIPKLIEVSIRDLAIMNGRGLNMGGAIHNKGILTLNDLLAEQNEVYSISQVAFGGGICNDTFATISMSGCIIRDNTADVGAGQGLRGIGFANNLGDATIVSCKFLNNVDTAHYLYGGGIYTKEGKMDISHSIIDSNIAFASSLYSLGAGLGNLNTVINMNNCSIRGNICGSNYRVLGAGIYTQVDTFNADSCEILGNNAISSNYFRGAGFATIGKGPAVYLKNTSIKNNRGFSVFSFGQGGAIYAQELEMDSLFLSNCVISNNEINVFSSGWGGAIMNLYSYLQLDSCEVDSNRMVGGAGQGGAIRSHNGGMVASNSSFTGNILEVDNYAFGGGIVAVSEVLKLYDCEISKNSVLCYNNTAAGGGIATGNADVTIKGSKIRGNSCDGPGIVKGGGLDITGNASYSELKMTNSLVSGNYCESTAANLPYGGGLSVTSTNDTCMRLVNVTITANNVVNPTASNSQCGGLLNNAPVGIIANCVIWGNNAEVFPNACSQVGYILRNTLIEGVDTVGEHSSNLDGTDSTISNLFYRLPSYVFAPTCGGDLRLLRCSPLIDRGDSTLLPSTMYPDLAGSMRVKFDNVDIGAYEFQSIPDGSNMLVFVDSSNTSGIEDGISWATAYTDLQTAIDRTCEKDTIWVAKGNYYPARNKDEAIKDKFKTFFINKNIIILGGFQGDETSVNDRDWEANQTVLNGDIGVKGDSSDNVYHVVWMQHLDSCMLLDGFTITGGHAPDLNGPENAGAGIYNRGAGPNKFSNPTLRNLHFINNTAYFAAALFNDGTDGGEISPLISQCIFERNFGINGSAVYNYVEAGVTSRPTFRSCDFISNRTPFNGSGTVINAFGEGGSMHPVFDSCTFVSNYAGQAAGIYNWANRGTNNMHVSNCIFMDNYVEFSGAVFYQLANSEPGEIGVDSSIIENCIFKQNKAGYAGGAISINTQKNSKSLQQYRNCSFIGNSAGINGGGAVVESNNLGYQLPTYINCLFSGNKSDGEGGAIQNWYYETQTPPVGDSTVDVSKYINCTFAANSSDKGSLIGYTGIIQSTNPTAYYSNVVVWGNSGGFVDTLNTASFFSHCLIQDTLYPGPGNLDGKDPNQDPVFNDLPDYNLAPTCDGDFAINSCSSLYNKGTNDSIPVDILTDLAGNQRIQYDTVDIGAYESDEPRPLLNCMNITVTLDEGNYTLTSIDSLNLIEGSSSCFDSIWINRNTFNCLDLVDSPIEITVSGSSPNGYSDECMANITVLEDPDYCCSYSTNSLNYHIESVEFRSTSDTLVNASGDNGGLGSFTHLVTEVNAGSRMEIDLLAYSINLINYKYWDIWIDYNDDETYDPNELVYSYAGNQIERSTSVVIPTGIEGERTMRIIMQLNPNSSTSNPCGPIGLGEVEEYTLYINSCPEVLILQDQSLGGVYAASKEIITKGEVIVGSETEFRAEEFFLGKEFRVVDGVLFQTVKDPCGVVIPPSID